MPCFGIVASPCLPKSFVFSVTLPGVAFCLTRQNEFASEGGPLPRPRIRLMQEVLENSVETEGVVKHGSENGGTIIVANAMPNKGVQPTAYSVRSCVAPASSGG